MTKVCIPLIKNNIDSRHLFAATIIAIGLSLFLALFVIRYNTSVYLSGLKNQEFDLILGAIESGPVAFARLQSADLSQQALDRLMNSSAISNHGVTSIVISGGAEREYTYAQWNSVNQQPPNDCLIKQTKTYTFPDAISPFVVGISFNKCSILPQNKNELLYLSLIIIVLFLIPLLIILILGAFVFKSVRDAEELIGKNSKKITVNDIQFIPIRKIAQLALINAELESKALKIQIMDQLSHDIRSPIAALDIFSSSLSEISENNRVILRNAINRIRDIANTLVSKQSTNQVMKTQNNWNNQDERESVLLAPIIEGIVSEKRIEHRDKIGIKIDFEQTAKNYGLFCKVEHNDLKRVLSNIMNNSIESFTKNSGRISLRLDSNGSNIDLLITDNGSGIHPEILSKIGKRGATFNKEHGSGLGLAHAIDCAKTWGGELKINSTQGQGTTVTLSIPSSNAPSWFVSNIALKSISNLIIVDDDQSIHELWERRFHELQNHTGSLRLIHLSSPQQLMSYYRENFGEGGNTLYLIDYEFQNTNESGLDLIEKLGLTNEAILVTSHHDEPQIISRCKILNARLIPKPMCGFVPITF